MYLYSIFIGELKMKVILNYDKLTGILTDNNGMIITTWIGLEREEYIETNSSSKVDSAVIRDLAEAPNISILDILELKNNGLI